VTTLRILLPDAPRADRADAWALFAADGRAVRQGRDAPQGWPAAERIEAVVAAARARVVVLDLPPMAAQRVPAAAAFALEDQLAGGGAPPAIATGPQAADGCVIAAVCDRALVDAIEASGTFARIVPESALPSTGDEWTWHRSAAGGGFVTTPQGAFAVTLQDDAVPAELAAALAQARRAGRAPAAMGVAFDIDARTLAHWSDATGVAVVPRAPWRWLDATEEQYARAPDWHAPPVAPSRTRAARASWFRPALVLASLALALHVGATLVQWAALRFEAWRIGRDTVALAQGAGVADATTPAAAVAGLVRRHADARHRAGLAAPGDALPLLAQAAPSLAALPPGTLKSAIYGDGAWTLELGKVDPAALARIDRALSERGLAVLQAPTAAGSRMRLTASP
jgi:hypothetical protein